MARRQARDPAQGHKFWGKHGGVFSISRSGEGRGLKGGFRQPRQKTESGGHSEGKRYTSEEAKKKILSGRLAGGRSRTGGVQARREKIVQNV